ncbi:MAG: endonuclease/exonuclease/phosphatase family protein [Planctomycetes bacterium]|nr:endonuclease/exonuclease/phosphatase family protein [Planctomycetota bacterium]
MPVIASRHVTPVTIRTPPRVAHPSHPSTMDAPRVPAWGGRVADTDVVRCITINTHRGRGPQLEYVTRSAPSEAAARRAEMLHATRAYVFHVADWIRRHRDRYDVVALQEVFHGVLGFDGLRLRAGPRQRDYYRELTEYPSAVAHRVGFAGFRYENVLLSSLPPASDRRIDLDLPCPVFRLAACGFTLAPYRLRDRTVWIGNTHLHAYNPKARSRQAAAIAREVRRLGDAPVIFLGDLNTVPPGCKDGDFEDGERDVRSYKGDRTLEILAKAGLRTVAHDDSAAFWTYPTGAANRTLDYVLATRHWKLDDYRVVRDFQLSDHDPVEATWTLGSASRPL